MKERTPYAILADFILTGKGMTDQEKKQLEKDQSEKEKRIQKKIKKHGFN